MRKCSTFNFNGKLLNQILENVDLNKVKQNLKKKEQKDLDFLKQVVDSVFIKNQPETFQCSDSDLFRIKDLIPKLTTVAKQDKKEIMLLMCDKFTKEFDKQLKDNNKQRPKIFSL